MADRFSEASVCAFLKKSNTMWRDVDVDDVLLLADGLLLIFLFVSREER